MTEPTPDWQNLSDAQLQERLTQWRPWLMAKQDSWLRPIAERFVPQIEAELIRRTPHD